LESLGSVSVQVTLWMGFLAEKGGSSGEVGASGWVGHRWSCCCGSEELPRVASPWELSHTGFGWEHS